MSQKQYHNQPNQPPASWERIALLQVFTGERKPVQLAARSLPPISEFPAIKINMGRKKILDAAN